VLTDEEAVSVCPFKIQLDRFTSRMFLKLKTNLLTKSVQSRQILLRQYREFIIGNDAKFGAGSVYLDHNYDG
jgi:hypothetical protein